VLVTAGLLNKQIAHKLGATERTIKVHRRQVMEKQDAESVAHLVRIADQLGVKQISKEEREENFGSALCAEPRGNAFKTATTSPSPRKISRSSKEPHSTIVQYAGGGRAAIMR